MFDEAKTNGGVPALINGYAGHDRPYPVAAIAESLLLRGGGGKGATSDIELIPPNRSRSGGVSHHYGLISPQRLRATNYCDTRPAS